MDINLLLKAGMKACGRVLKLLPTDGPDGIGSPTKYMMRTIEEDTLPSLDILVPFLIKKTFSVDALIPVDVNESDVFSIINDNRLAMKYMNDDRYSTYRIPSEITDGQKIVTIKSCVPVNANGTAMGSTLDNFYNERPWNSNFGRTSSGDLYGMVMASAVDYADRQLMGSIHRNFRFYFFEPNILVITNYSGTLNATFAVRNDPSLITIGDMAFEGVRKLFILDLKKNIYNEYGNFTEIDTAFGTLDLKIGDWSNAESERNELFDTYRATSHFRTSSMRS